jgi:enoyl-CoA hydratase
VLERPEEEVPIDQEVIITRCRHAGLIELNRPRALNALTAAIVDDMAQALDAFEREPEIAHVVVYAAPGRAFCAGGDIRELYEQIQRGDYASALAFWAAEYRLNRRIKRYSKPYVAVIDGIVMGGGVGISVHGSHRIATERYRFAMPEVGIGFFPDVGTSYVLTRCPDSTGRYLALTGLGADCGDGLALGLATAYVPSAQLEALIAALTERGDTQAAINQFARPPPRSPIVAQTALIQRCFSGADINRILSALERERDSDFAATARSTMATKSPSSLHITLRQMQLSAGLDFDEALRMDYRIVSRVCRGHDFSEGVRAVIIDKDNRPEWQPASVDALEPSTIAAYFATLRPDEELRFEALPAP